MTTASRPQRSAGRPARQRPARWNRLVEILAVAWGRFFEVLAVVTMIAALAACMYSIVRPAPAPLVYNTTVTNNPTVTIAPPTATTTAPPKARG